MHYAVAQPEGVHSSGVVGVVVQHEVAGRLDQSDVGHEVGHEAGDFEFHHLERKSHVFYCWWKVIKGKWRVRKDKFGNEKGHGK
jgi:hypothetical protein